MFGHDLARRRTHNHAVGAADWRRGGDDDLVAVTVDRFHRIPADLQGIGVWIGDLGQTDLIPASPGGVAAVIENPGASGLREADQRDAPVYDPLHRAR